MAVRDLWLTARTKQRTARWGQGNRYQVNWEVDGQRRSKTFARKIDANDFDAELRHRVRSGTYVDPVAGTITVRDYATGWLEQRLRLRPGSRARYASHLSSHVYPAIGKLAMGDVRKSTVQGLVSGLVAKGLAPGTVRSIARTMSIVFRAAVGDQVIARSPCEKVEVPEPAKSRAEALTPAQLFGLAEHMPAHFRALPLVGGGCGLRPGELFGLELDPSRSLDMLGRRILVRQQLASVNGGGMPYLAPPKTAAGVRDVPLADETLQFLAEHMAAFPPVEVVLEDRTGPRPVRRPVRLVFYAVEEMRAGVRRTPIRRSTFNRTWTRGVERARAAGVVLPARVTPHSLRHTYVSLMIAAGQGPKVIQKRVGHAGISETYDTYGHLFPEEDESTRAAIGAAFRSTDAPGLRSVR